MKRLLALTAAACLIAAPLSFAQTQPPTPQTPPPTQTTPVPTPSNPTTAPPATSPPVTTPAPSTTPAAPSTPSATTPAGEPQGCRTRKAEGEPCACLSDTSRIGVSTPNSAGQNICVRPS
jgi:outer membrane biosynthesis protein TonB